MLVCAQDIRMEREYECMVIGVGLLVPPGIQEFSESYEIDTTAAFSEELSAPLVEHLLHIEFCGTFRSIQHRFPVGGRIVALTD